MLDFLNPFFIFWGSELLSYIIYILIPFIAIFSFIRLIGGVFDV